MSALTVTVEVRLRDDALREALGDDLPHLGHRLRLLGHGALHVGNADASAVAGRDVQQIHAFFRRQLLGGGTDAEFVVTARLQILLHVTFDHAALWTGAFDRRRINHASLGQNRRARADAEKRGSCGSGRGLDCWSNGLLDWCRGSGGNCLRCWRGCGCGSRRFRRGWRWRGHGGSRFTGLAEKTDRALHRDIDARTNNDFQQCAFLESSPLP